MSNEQTQTAPQPIEERGVTEVLNVITDVVVIGSAAAPLIKDKIKRK